jgi:hypothetical protein
MEEFMVTQQTPQPPPEEDTEAPLLPSQQSRVNTFADLKLAEAPLAQASPDALRGGHHYYQAERIPPELVDGAKRALKEMNLPGEIGVATIYTADFPIDNPNRQKFAIPGYGGEMGAVGRSQIHRQRSSNSRRLGERGEEVGTSGTICCAGQSSLTQSRCCGSASGDDFDFCRIIVHSGKSV